MYPTGRAGPWTGCQVIEATPAPDWQDCKAAIMEMHAKELLNVAGREQLRESL